MKFESRRRLGIFLMVISVVFLITALYTLFSFVDERDYRLGNIPISNIHSELPIVVQDRGELWYGDPNIMYGGTVYPQTYKWHLRWLTQPLTIFGIFLFVSGLLLGYHDDISELF